MGQPFDEAPSHTASLPSLVTAVIPKASPAKMKTNVHPTSSAKSSAFPPLCRLVAERAYTIWPAKGQRECDCDHWVQAERQLLLTTPNGAEPWPPASRIGAIRSAPTSTSRSPPSRRPGAAQRGLPLRGAIRPGCGDRRLPGAPQQR